MTFTEFIKKFIKFIAKKKKFCLNLFSAYKFYKYQRFIYRNGNSEN